MRRISIGILCLSLISTSSVLRSAYAQTSRDTGIPTRVAPDSNHDAAVRSRVLENYGKLPLRFEENQGQTDPSVRFLARGTGYTLFLTSGGAVLSVSSPAPSTQRQTFDEARTVTVLRMDLMGTNSHAAVSASDEFPGKSNYFIGNDPKQWHRGVPAFGKVRYNDIYPGVDLVYYGKQRQLEYDFVVAPGADAGAIRLKIEGAPETQIAENGDLVFGVGPENEVRLGAPSIYQEEHGTRHKVDGKWARSGANEFHFALGAYDRKRELIIDPSLTYSTYLGGASNDGATAVAVDSSGDAFITGFTGSANFPTTQGAFQTTCGGCTGSGKNNAFITELDPTGATQVFSTFLGGGNGDGANGIAIDASGNAYIVGTTFSSNFPTTSNGFQLACAGGCTNGDAFVSEISSPAGTPPGSTLTFSTFLGGDGTDKGNGIALDASGNVYVTGSTNSNPFPTQNPIQSAFGGGAFDAFVAEFDSTGSALVYSTYLGGAAEDDGKAIAVDSSGNAYVTGLTYSTNFPTVSPLQAANAGNDDVFITKVNSTGTAWVFSTYLGGSGNDASTSIALDSSNNVYVAGSTNSTAFPTKTPFQSSCNSCSSTSTDAFLTKINSSGNALVYSTYLGGSANDQATALMVDPANNAFVVGQTYSTDFPVANTNYETQATCKSCATGGHDAFVTEFDQAGNGLIFSTYLGGSTAQSAFGVGISPAETAIVAGSTTSSDFPTTTGAFQTTLAGGQDAFITAYPGAASCTTTKNWTAAGMTITATMTCNGLFLPSSFGNSINQFMGFQWGDGSSDGSGSGGGNNCANPTGTCTFSATHTYTSGSYQGSQTVTDASSGSGNNIVTTGFSVNIPEITVLTTTLAGGTVSTAYSQTVSAQNGNTPYTWSISAGTLPAGLTLNSTTGVISGTPTATGKSNFTVQVSDSATPTPNITTQALSITISTALTITTSSLPGGTVSTAYNQTLQASGGTSPYSWSISSGSLPAGLTLSTAGVISGTPTTAGTSTFTVKVTDANSSTATKSLSIVIVQQLKVTTTTLPEGIVSTTYSQTLQASGGTSPYSWSISSGSLPAGLTLSTAGVISGSPTAAGTSNFTVKVTDANSNTATQALSITVVSQVLITTTSLPAGVVGSAYNQTLQATGGSSPYTWSISSGSLPAGLTLSTAGVISGTPSTSGTANFTVEVTDSNSNKATAPLSILVVNGLTVTTSSLPAGTVGIAYTQTLQAAGGSSPYSWSISAGSLPAGLSLSSAGVISGTPTTTGTSNFTAKVTDASSNTATAALSITIVSQLTVTTTSLPSGTTSVAYSQTLQASGGSTPYTWSISSGNLPAGLTLSTAGVISGTPTAAGTSNFTVKVTDANSNTATAALSIAIVSQLTVTTTSLPSGTTSVAYSQTLQASGGSTPYTWSISSGNLPAGLTLSTAGVISGTPTAAGTSNFTVKVTDANSSTATAALSITITAPVSPPTCQPPTVTVQDSSNPLSVTATSNCTDSGSTITTTTINWGDDSSSSSGTTASHTYTLPSGTASGAFTVTVTATNANNLTASASGTVTVTAPVSTPVTQGGTAQQTVNVSAPAGVTLQLTYKCTSVDGPTGLGTLSTYNLSCNINNSGSTASVTLTSTPTALPISVQTNSTSSQSAGLSGTGSLYAAFLFAPAIVLLGAGSLGSRRRKLGACAALLVLGVLMISGLGCGGGTTNPPPVNNKTPTGTYSVTVSGTDSSGNTQSTITVGFTVTVGG